MKELLYLVLVPIVVILGNVVMEWFKNWLSKHAEMRKERQSSTSAAIVAKTELKKVEEQTELELLKAFIQRGETLEKYVDDLRVRLHKEQDEQILRLRRENFMLRTCLNNLLGASFLLRHNIPDAAAKMVEVADTILKTMAEKPE